mmetsp:Transcript_96307/g.272283  ORF Transcript_96307/g.272283 Transcript_96307/m.272283 type:complete len:258 (+) Transcript_96307:2165-2938(+)
MRKSDMNSWATSSFRTGFVLRRPSRSVIRNVSRLPSYSDAAGDSEASTIVLQLPPNASQSKADKGGLWNKLLKTGSDNRARVPLFDKRSTNCPRPDNSPIKNSSFWRRSWVPKSTKLRVERRSRASPSLPSNSRLSSSMKTQCGRRGSFRKHLNCAQRVCKLNSSSLCTSSQSKRGTSSMPSTYEPAFGLWRTARSLCDSFNGLNASCTWLPWISTHDKFKETSLSSLPRSSTSTSTTVGNTPWQRTFPISPLPRML